MHIKKNTPGVIANNRGITLIEMLLTLAMLSMVLMVGFSIHHFGSNAFHMGEERAQVRFNVRMAADFITQELRYATHVKVLASVPSESSFDDEYRYIYVQDGLFKYRTAGGSAVLAFSHDADQINFLPLSFHLNSTSDKWYLEYEIGNAGIDDYHLASRLSFLNELQESYSDSTYGIAIAYKSNTPPPLPPNNGLIPIEGTDIYRPDVTINDGEIMVFKGDKSVLLSLEELLKPLVVDAKVDELNRPDLIGGSLYIPASAGDLFVQKGNETIDWTVEGNVILEPDIIINNNNTVNILSRNGDVILNNTSISGQPQPYIVSITAQNGSIEANGSLILTKHDGSGVILLEAQQDINIRGAEFTSEGSHGLKILSESGNIDASNSILKSTNGSVTANVIIRSPGHINLDAATVESNGSIAPPTPALWIESINQGISAQNAALTSTNSGKLLEVIAQGPIDFDQTTVSSQGALTITTAGDISARSANMVNYGWGNSILISSTNGAINLSSLESSDLPRTNISSGDNIHIKSHDDIRIISSIITASTSWGKELRFEATGSNSKLWSQNADLTPLPTIINLVPGT